MKILKVSLSAVVAFMLIACSESVSQPSPSTQDPEVTTPAPSVLSLAEILESCDPALFPEVPMDQKAQVVDKWTACDQSPARAFVASSPQLSLTHVEALVCDRSPDVQQALAGNPLTSTLLAQLVKDGSDELRLSLAGCETLPPETLQILSADVNPKVREAVVGNAGASEEVLVALASDDTPAVQEAVVRRQLGVGRLCGKNISADNYIGSRDYPSYYWTGKTVEGKELTIGLIASGCNFFEMEQILGLIFNGGTWRQNGSKVQFDITQDSLYESALPPMGFTGKISGKSLEIRAEGKTVARLKPIDAKTKRPKPIVAPPLYAAPNPQSPSTGTSLGSGSDIYYEVSGSASRANVTIRTSTGTSQRQVTLPWRQRVSGVKPGDFLYVSAQNDSDDGGVSCAIFVNGTSISSNSSLGAYVIASCQGTYMP